MKKIVLFCFLSISITSCSQKSSESSESFEWIPIVWDSDSISGKHFEKLAMNIPVTVDELPYKFTMQFDLGAVTTNFYGNSLKPFLEKYPYLNNKLDTTKTFLIQGQVNPMFRNVDLTLGKVAFKNLDVGLFSTFGDEYVLDSINTETELHIGTIGPDLVQNKVLIIDFKSDQLAIVDSLPTAYQNASFENFKIERGRIKLPFKINGTSEDLMFDTGSSIFSLITSKQNALEIGGKKIVDSLTVSSWGELMTVYELETVVPIVFNGEVLEKSMVYYTEDIDLDDFCKSQNIWGITGNAFFFNSIIIIDYKNNRFGIM